MNNNSWQNEVKSTLTIVGPPSLYLPTNGPSIFLAGSIDGGNAIEWQKEAIHYIEKSWIDDDITIYNPRREIEYDSKWDAEQHAWGISFLEACDYILMHLSTKVGVSPISLLELGLYCKNQKLYLSIDEEYPKKFDVEVHYNFFAKKQIYKDIYSSIEAIKKDWKNKNV